MVECSLLGVAETVSTMLQERAQIACQRREVWLHEPWCVVQGRDEGRLTATRCHAGLVLNATAVLYQYGRAAKGRIGMFLGVFFQACVILTSSAQAQL